MSAFTYRKFNNKLIANNLKIFNFLITHKIRRVSFYLTAGVTISRLKTIETSYNAQFKEKNLLRASVFARNESLCLQKFRILSLKMWSFKDSRSRDKQLLELKKILHICFNGQLNTFLTLIIMRWIVNYSQFSSMERDIQFQPCELSRDVKKSTIVIWIWLFECWFTEKIPLSFDALKKYRWK